MRRLSFPAVLRLPSSALDHDRELGLAVDELLKVPTVMVRFNNEWHGTSSTPSNFLRTQAFLRSWFERWPAKPTM